MKRAVDIALALATLVLLSPLLLITALAIRATMGGPALIAHTRVGLNGKVFRRYKFRTMASDAEQGLRIGREWEHDPRVTALGQILHKASIDDLPQLINVLRGDMSCVGPRPVTTHELQRYGACAADYLMTRPGLTGLWRVSGRNSLTYADRIELDSLYVRSWSMALDFAILIRTIPAHLKFNQTT